MRPNSTRPSSTIVLLGLLIVPLLVAPASGAPTVDLSWDDCSVLSQERAPGTLMVLYATVTGVTEHTVAYQVGVELVPSGSGYPDAWNFMEGGCQDASRLTFNPIPPKSLRAACPPLSNDQPGLTISAMRWTDIGATGSPPRAVVQFAYAYPTESWTDDTFVPDPAVRYHLAGIAFDHSSSVTEEGAPGTSCGGFDEGLEFRLVPVITEWLDLDTREDIQFAIGQGTLRVSSAASSPVDAATTSWGLIKAQYRR